jgi:hypothetical protein
MSKIAAQEPRIPSRGAIGSAGYVKGDFAFNPATLGIVSAAITEASGLTPHTMFTPKISHLKTTIRWALNELNDLRTFEGTGKEKERDCKVVAAFLNVLGGIEMDEDGN